MTTKKTPAAIRSGPRTTHLPSSPTAAARMPQGYVGRPFGRPFGTPLPVLDETLPFDEILGTQGDAVRHHFTRAAFMRELCGHPRVLDAFARWGEESGIYPAARKFAKARDEYA